MNMQIHAATDIYLQLCRIKKAFNDHLLRAEITPFFLTHTETQSQTNKSPRINPG